MQAKLPPPLFPYFTALLFSLSLSLPYPSFYVLLALEIRIASSNLMATSNKQVT